MNQTFVVMFIATETIFFIFALSILYQLRKVRRELKSFGKEVDDFGKAVSKPLSGNL